MTPRRRSIDEVKASGLRGRGGAGLPDRASSGRSCRRTTASRTTSCCNADESEPGTFKDREIMRWTPHALIEGCAIARARDRRGDGLHLHPRRVHRADAQIMQAAVEEAYASGRARRERVRQRQAGSTSCCIAGAGAYICGEETAMMNSHRGEARQSRASSRRSRRWPGCSACRRRSTTSRRWPRCRTSSSAAPSGTRRSASATRRAPAPSCSRCAATCSGPATTRSTMGTPDEGPHLRHVRRHAARPDAQGGDPRRLLGADHDRRGGRGRACWTTRASSRRARCSARAA